MTNLRWAAPSDAANEVTLAVRALSRVLGLGGEVTAFDAGDGSGIFSEELFVLLGDDRHCFTCRRIEGFDNDRPPREALRRALSNERVDTIV